MPSQTYLKTMAYWYPRHLFYLQPSRNNYITVSIPLSGLLVPYPLLFWLLSHADVNRLHYTKYSYQMYDVATNSNQQEIQIMAYSLWNYEPKFVFPPLSYLS